VNSVRAGKRCTQSYVAALVCPTTLPLSLGSAYLDLSANVWPWIVLARVSVPTFGRYHAYTCDIRLGMCDRCGRVEMVVGPRHCHESCKKTQCYITLILIPQESSTPVRRDARYRIVARHRVRPCLNDGDIRLTQSRAPIAILNILRPARFELTIPKPAPALRLCRPLLLITITFADMCIPLSSDTLINRPMTTVRYDRRTKIRRSALGWLGNACPPHM